MLVRQIPNTLTVFRLLSLPVFVWLYGREVPGAAWPAAVLLFFAALSDVADGFIARRYHLESDFGRILDPFVDRALYVTLLLTLLYYGTLPLWAVLPVVIRDAILVRRGRRAPSPARRATAHHAARQARQPRARLRHPVLHHRRALGGLARVRRRSAALPMVRRLVRRARRARAAAETTAGVGVVWSRRARRVWTQRRPRGVGNGGREESGTAAAGPAFGTIAGERCSWETTSPCHESDGEPVRAVVMAGGEGTRLRPLTSNQPKPMVPVCTKPCMEYIVELLQRHGIEETVVTLAFLPKSMRDYFGDGSALGLKMQYSVEQAPAGTAGSVKLAESNLRDETFLVISGDALTDFDLTAIVEFHRARGALATIALKRVENPLEFGVVVVDEEGRIQRFLEKPTWGQVFSDTVNTGIYVLEPEVFDHMPADCPYDFSQDLFPKLFEMGAPLYGYVAEGYWQDIGSLGQFLAANRDVLDGKVQVTLPGIRLDNNVYIGETLSLDSLDNVTGPAMIGNYAKIDAEARIGPYSVLGSNVVVKGHAETGNCVIDANTYIGSSAKVRGAILGKNCDVKAGASLSEGVAVGDECVIGEQAYIAPDVKIYPFKTVDSGAQIQSSIIWESRGTSQLFGKDGIAGLINVDITPELALKFAMAYGTVLAKGAKVTTQPRRSPCLASHQASHHQWAQRDRRRGARPTCRLGGHQSLRDQERQRRRAASTCASPVGIRR